MNLPEPNKDIINKDKKLIPICIHCGNYIKHDWDFCACCGNAINQQEGGKQWIKKKNKYFG